MKPKWLKKQIEERFVYSRLVHIIISIIFLAVSFLLISLAKYGFNIYDGQPVRLSNVCQVVFFFMIFFAGFVIGLFSMFSLVLAEGYRHQMMLCHHGLWPEPKKLRSETFGSNGLDYY